MNAKDDLLSQHKSDSDERPVNANSRPYNEKGNDEDNEGSCLPRKEDTQHTFDERTKLLRDSSSKNEKSSERTVKKCMAVKCIFGDVKLLKVGPLYVMDINGMKTKLPQSINRDDDLRLENLDEGVALLTEKVCFEVKLVGERIVLYNITSRFFAKPARALRPVEKEHIVSEDIDDNEQQRRTRIGPYKNTASRDIDGFDIERASVYSQNVDSTVAPKSTDLTVDLTSSSAKTKEVVAVDKPTRDIDDEDQLSQEDSALKKTLTDNVVKGRANANDPNNIVDKASPKLQTVTSETSCTSTMNAKDDLLSQHKSDSDERPVNAKSRPYNEKGNDEDNEGSCLPRKEDTQHIFDERTKILLDSSSKNEKSSERTVKKCMAVKCIFGDVKLLKVGPLYIMDINGMKTKLPQSINRDDDLRLENLDEGVALLTEKVCFEVKLVGERIVLYNITSRFFAKPARALRPVEKEHIVSEDIDDNEQQRRTRIGPYENTASRDIDGFDNERASVYSQNVDSTVAPKSTDLTVDLASSSAKPKEVVAVDKPTRDIDDEDQLSKKDSAFKKTLTDDVVKGRPNSNDPNNIFAKASSKLHTVTSETSCTSTMNAKDDLLSQHKSDSDERPVNAKSRPYNEKVNDEDNEGSCLPRKEDIQHTFDERTKILLDSSSKNEKSSERTVKKCMAVKCIFGDVKLLKEGPLYIMDINGMKTKLPQSINRDDDLRLEKLDEGVALLTAKVCFEVKLVGERIVLNNITSRFFAKPARALQPVEKEHMVSEDIDDNEQQRRTRIGPYENRASRDIDGFDNERASVYSQNVDSTVAPKSTDLTVDLTSSSAKTKEVVAVDKPTRDIDDEDQLSQEDSAFKKTLTDNVVKGRANANDPNNIVDKASPKLQTVTSETSCTSTMNAKDDLLSQHKSDSDERPVNAKSRPYNEKGNDEDNEGSCLPRKEDTQHTFDERTQILLDSSSKNEKGSERTVKKCMAVKCIFGDVRLLKEGPLYIMDINGMKTKLPQYINRDDDLRLEELDEGVALLTEKVCFEVKLVGERIVLYNITSRFFAKPARALRPVEKEHIVSEDIDDNEQQRRTRIGPYKNTASRDIDGFDIERASVYSQNVDSTVAPKSTDLTVDLTSSSAKPKEVVAVDKPTRDIDDKDQLSQEASAFKKTLTDNVVKGRANANDPNNIVDKASPKLQTVTSETSCTSTMNAKDDLLSQHKSDSDERPVNAKSRPYNEKGNDDDNEGSCLPRKEDTQHISDERTKILLDSSSKNEKSSERTVKKCMAVKCIFGDVKLLKVVPLYIMDINGMKTKLPQSINRDDDLRLENLDEGVALLTEKVCFEVKLVGERIVLYNITSRFFAKPARALQSVEKEHIVSEDIDDNEQQRRTRIGPYENTASRDIDGFDNERASVYSQNVDSTVAPKSTDLTVDLASSSAKPKEVVAVDKPTRDIDDEDQLSKKDSAFKKTLTDDVVKGESIPPTKNTRGIKITLKRGKLNETKADVLVNTASPDLNLKKGAVSWSLLQTAGSQLQSEIKHRYPTGIKPSELAVTGGYKLQCQFVFHGALRPCYQRDREKLLLEFCYFIRTCLLTANTKGAKTIAFPAIGTGNLGYSTETVVDEMYKAVNNYKADNPRTNLEEVIFVVFDGDHATCEAFEKRQKLEDTNQTPLLRCDTRASRQETPVKMRINITGHRDNTAMAMTMFQKQLSNKGMQRKEFPKDPKPTTYAAAVNDPAFKPNPSAKTIEEISVPKYMRDASCCRTDEPVPDTYGAALKEPTFEPKPSAKPIEEISVPKYMRDTLCCRADEPMHATYAAAVNNPTFESNPSAKSIGEISVPRWDALFCRTDGGIDVKVYQADLLNLTVDCIVNPANNTLDHSGGLANVIAKEAGRTMIDACNTHVRKYGPVKVGTALSTISGKLSRYKCVIHAVGPNWVDYSPHYAENIMACRNDLKGAILSSLRVAETNHMSTIAIPAVSSGIYGVPGELCVMEYINAVKDFSATSLRQSRTLKEVHFVDRNPDMVALMKQGFDEALIKKQPFSWNWKVYTKREPARVDRKINAEGDGYSSLPYFVDDGNTLTCKLANARCVAVSGEDIFSFKNDVIVCSEDQSGIAVGGVAKLLLKKGGWQYQQEKERAFQLVKPKTGKLLITGGGTTGYKAVYHAIMPHRMQYKDEGSWTRALGEMISEIFDKADKYRHQTMVMSLLGTGAGKSDPKQCAQILFDCVSSSCMRYSDSPLFLNIVNNNPAHVRIVSEVFKASITESKKLLAGPAPSEPGAQRSKQHSVPQTGGNHGVKPKVRHQNDGDKCSVCLDGIRDPKTIHCGHTFCKRCIDEQFKEKPLCPTCNALCGVYKGNQPDGVMTIEKVYMTLPGYDCQTIKITYNMSGGVQGERHPSPGKRFYGFSRIAYLPYNQDGREVCALLKLAFERRLIFTIGRSRTTNAYWVVTWNNIHHKTSMTPHAEGIETVTCSHDAMKRENLIRFDYPDPGYFKRVKGELAAKGVSVSDKDFDKNLMEKLDLYHRIVSVKDYQAIETRV